MTSRCEPFQPDRHGDDGHGAQVHDPKTKKNRRRTEAAADAAHAE
jgi:hypothetical protein